MVEDTVKLTVRLPAHLYRVFKECGWSNTMSH